MTLAEIKALKYGTPIRAKKSVRCLDEFKRGGILIFKRGWQVWHTNEVMLLYDLQSGGTGNNS